ncbi:hypothetical protein INR49_010595 [Caranx melampygus]|nr:hypothetical protein INR49_010595 [Caranx melampygus]
MAKLAVCVSVLLLVATQLELSESNHLKICCTEYQEKPIPKRWIRYYVNQDIGVCNIEAVIFVLVNKRLVCANPKSDWVEDIIGVSTKHQTLGNIYVGGH